MVKEHIKNGEVKKTHYTIAFAVSEDIYDRWMALAEKHTWHRSNVLRANFMKLLEAEEKKLGK